MRAGITWQSMDSAPRDGTRILGWFGDRCIVVWWRSGPPTTKYRAADEKVWFWSSGYFRHPEPDCWQPEPQPPEAAVFPNTQPVKPPPTRRSYAKVRPIRREKRVVVEVPKRRALTEKPRVGIADSARLWCAQCEMTVTAEAASRCLSPFCKAKVEAA